MTILSKILVGMRRSLGITHLQAQLDDLEALLRTVAQPPAPLQLPSGYPRGPVYFGDDTILVATRWGAKMLLYTHDVAITPWLALDGLWETQVTDWLTGTLRPGDIFVDVGANVGYFTLLAGSLVGREGQVVAVEAHPQLASVLRRNIVINGMYEFVKSYHCAVWSSRTSLTFYLRERFAGNSSIGSIGDEALLRLGDQEIAIQVEARPLDELLAGLPKVDVIKIDVEGAEYQALSGLTETLAANPGIRLMLEWSLGQLAANGTRPDDLLDILDQQGFSLVLLESGGRAVSRQDLLSLPYGNLVASR